MQALVFSIPQCFPALSAVCLVLLVIAFLGNNIPNYDA